MTLKQVAKQLQDQGIDVKFRIRPDGGIVITSIAGQKYSERQGNIRARQMAGVPIATEAISQRSRISRAGVQSRVSGIRVSPIPNDLMKALQKTQRIFRKAGQAQSAKTGLAMGTPTKSIIRKKLEEGMTVDEIKQFLGQSERYARGLALLQDLKAIRNKAQTEYDLSEGFAPKLKQGVDLLNKIIEAGAPNAFVYNATEAAQWLYEFEKQYDGGNLGEALEAAKNFYENVKEME